MRYEGAGVGEVPVMQGNGEGETLGVEPVSKIVPSATGGSRRMFWEMSICLDMAKFTNRHSYF